jgi:hypothetical protein
MLALVALVTVMSTSAPAADGTAPYPSILSTPLKLLPNFAGPRSGLTDLPGADPMSDLHTVGYDLGFAPHVGVSMTTYARPNESGATLRIGDARSFLTGKLHALGVSTEKPYGGAGRWYLFAAARSQALDARPALRGLGDMAWVSGMAAQSPTLVSSNGKLGFGWSKGAMDTSVGYVARQVRVINGPMGASNGVNESVAALSFTFRPH